MKNYGEKITGYRKKVGLLQAELAEKLGVTRQAVSRWEHDVTEPDLESVKRMCRIFGITTDEFLFGEYVEYKDLRAASALDDDENALTETEATGERLPEEEEIAAAETATAATESIQRETGEDGFTLEHVLTDGDQEERLIEHIALREAVARLPERERTVIDLRYFHGLTQERTAKILGVSQVQVSRIEKKALQQLRTFF